MPALVVLDNWVGSATVPPAVAMFIAAAAAIVLTRTLPVWLGWLAALVALLLVVSAFSIFSADDEGGFFGILGFAGFLLFLIWILAAGIMLVVRAGREPVVR